MLTRTVAPQVMLKLTLALTHRSHLAVGSGAIKEDGHFGRLAALGMNKVAAAW